jgi:hypothetical protein
MNLALRVILIRLTLICKAFTIWALGVSFGVQDYSDKVQKPFIENNHFTMLKVTLWARNKATPL